MAFIYERKNHRVIDEERSIILQSKGLYPSPEGRIMGGRRFELQLHGGTIFFKMIIVNVDRIPEDGSIYWKARFVDIPESLKDQKETFFVLFDEAVRYFDDLVFYPPDPAPTDFSEAAVKYIP